jgi:plasmid stabilization system protein ParE
MNYELRLPPDTQREFREYLSGRFANDEDRRTAIDAIQAELEKLAVNPALGSIAYGGPFESRRTYLFSITVAGTAYYLRVAYALPRNTRTVVITGVSPLAL